MRGSWYHDSWALGILAEAIGDETQARCVLNDLTEDGWALLHRSASPSVRLARWLDADPERMAWVEHQLFPGEEWHVVLWLAPDTGSIASVFRPTRDEAITAALDQAEGVRDGRA